MGDWKDQLAAIRPKIRGTYEVGQEVWIPAGTSIDHVTSKGKGRMSHPYNTKWTIHIVEPQHVHIFRHNAGVIKVPRSFLDQVTWEAPNGMRAYGESNIIESIKSVQSLAHLFHLADGDENYKKLLVMSSINLGGNDTMNLEGHKRNLHNNAMETDERGVVGEINSLIKFLRKDMKHFKSSESRISDLAVRRVVDELLDFGKSKPPQVKGKDDPNTHITKIPSTKKSKDYTYGYAPGIKVS